MKYIKRHIEKTITEMSAQFGAVLITGARQVGKTTVLKEMNLNSDYVTLDDGITLDAAINNPGTFFKDTPPPVIVDEVQYAPNLFPYIKMILDDSRKKGQFYLTGSQQYHLMQNVSESLAGRLGIMNLMSLSLREINGNDFREVFMPTDAYYSNRKKKIVKNDYDSIWNMIHKGSLPETYSQPGKEWKRYYSSYTQTYIQRDVRNLAKVGDELKFMKFMTAIASRTGSLVNIASVANDVDISNTTAERWLSILVSSNIVYLLKPFHNNLLKRAVKTPKIYFLDTGLASYLTKWENTEVLKNGAMAGAFFETFVISEILKSYANNGDIDPPLYFYRDKEKKEIDLLIQKDGQLHPIEIKKHANPKKDDIKAFSVLDKNQELKRGSGGVICMYEKLISLDDMNKAIPVDYL